VKARVHILNGPNLSRLGRREPQVYGTTTLAELAGLCAGWAAALDLELTFDQCEGEGELVSLVHRAGDQADGEKHGPGPGRKIGERRHGGIQRARIG